MSRQHCSSTPDYNQPHEPAPPAYTPPPHAISTPNADPDNHAPTPSSTSATTDSNGGSKVPVNSFMYFRAHAVDMLCKKGLHHALFAIARDIWNEKTSEEKQWWKDRLDEANARCLLETGCDIVGQVPSYRIADLDAAKIAAPGRVEELYSWYVRHPPPIKPRTKGKKSAKTRPERSFLQSGDHAPSNARHGTRRRRRPRALRGVSQNDSDSSRSGSPSSVSTVQSSLGSDFAQAAAPAVYAAHPTAPPCPTSCVAAADLVFPAEHGQSCLEPSMQVYTSSEILATLCRIRRCPRTRTSRTRLGTSQTTSTPLWTSSTCVKTSNFSKLRKHNIASIQKCAYSMHKTSVMGGLILRHLMMAQTYQTW